MAKRKMLLLNGPNLNMLGTREPEVYGRDTLETLEQAVTKYAKKRGVELTCFQSNNEGKLIGKVHGALGRYDGIVYNPGAHTHYSYALRDAIASIDVPVVEVHLSDVDTRESFRQVSVIAPVCIAQIKGMGVEGYCRAIDVLLENDGLKRLGDDYRIHFAPDSNVRIAGQELPELKGSLEVAEIDGGINPLDPAAPFAKELSETDMGAVSEGRQARVREACGSLGLDALLVRDTPNIHWITGFDGVFDEERAHALLVTPDSSVLHTDSRYSNAMRKAAADLGSSVTVDDSRIAHFGFARQALVADADETFEGKLGFEDSITYAESVKATETLGAESLVPTTDVVLSLRAVKDAAEITRLRAAQAITDEAFRYIVHYMRPGMTEREVQLELESFMMRCGADGLAFGSIVACGENGADPHAVPSDKRLEAGQCVVMDFGARAFGYCSDMTRVVFLGEPEGEMARAWDVLRQANEAVEAMLRPGVTGAEAHNLAEQVLADGGFAGKMGHGLGHGVGLVCHELPVLNPRNDAPLAEGNVVTVEPGIYLPGKFGMRLEDCGVVTADGYDVFSQLGHEMVII